MTLPPVLATTWVVIEYLIKIAALGTVPENRRPSSSTAWLLLIFLLPLVGLPLYLLIGSPWVHGTRRRQQHTVNEITLDYTRSMPDLPKGARPSTYLAGALRMNRRLTGLPCVSGEVVAVHADPRSTYEAMARAIDSATDHVHVEFYIMSWDEVTDVFFAALERAVARGVTVRLLLDHLGSRKYPGWKQFCQRMTDAGIHWRLMMPLLPLKRRWRRPDLRNHRKILVVDGREAYIGSHNLVAPDYDTPSFQKAGITYDDTSVSLTGPIVTQIEAVFALDWYYASKEVLTPADLTPPTACEEEAPEEAPASSMQIIPSGPAFRDEPNLRAFVHMVSSARSHVSIASPYFIPDEALIAALTNAALSGVEVELFLSEQFDQFLVGHAQRSYYGMLLKAGVRIHLYRKPTMLHSKYVVVDGSLCAIGSSNMDVRSFGLNYEITLLADDACLVELLHGNDERNRERSRELTYEEWRGQPWHVHYVDNVCRLWSSLL